MRARGLAARRDPPRRAARCGPPSTAWAASRAASNCPAPTASRTAAGWARRPPRSSPACCWPARWCSAATSGCPPMTRVRAGGRTRGSSRQRRRLLLRRADGRLDRRRHGARAVRPDVDRRVSARSRSYRRSSPRPRQARGLLPAARAARRRRVHGRAQPRCCWRCSTGWPSADLPTPCSPRPRTGCTSRTGRRRCRQTAELVAAAARADGIAAVVSGAGPTVLVLARDQVEVEQIRALAPGRLAVRRRWPSMPTGARTSSRRPAARAVTRTGIPIGGSLLLALCRASRLTPAVNRRYASIGTRRPHTRKARCAHPRWGQTELPNLLLDRHSRGSRGEPNKLARPLYRPDRACPPCDGGHFGRIRHHRDRHPRADSLPPHRRMRALPPRRAPSAPP